MKSTVKYSPYNNQMRQAGGQDKLLWPHPSPASDLEPSPIAHWLSCALYNS